MFKNNDTFELAIVTLINNIILFTPFKNILELDHLSIQDYLDVFRKIGMRLFAARLR